MQRAVTVAVVLAGLGPLLCASPLAAQDAVLEKLPASVTVRIVQAATGEPVRAERVLIREPGAITTPLAEALAVEGEVRFPDLMVYNFKPYILSAWVDGVGYHVQRTGQTFLNGEVALIHVFEQTDDLSGLVATGMNVVVRRRERGYELEYVVTVDNRSRPQRTIRGQALPLRVALPEGVRDLAVEVDNGPDPLSAELRPTEGGLQGVAASLTPGEARITVRGLLPVADRTEFTVATNLAMPQWSLLAWPAEIAIECFDLDRDRDNTYTEFSRWLGRPLEPGQAVRVAIGTAAEVATGQAVPAPTGETAAGEGASRPETRRFPWVTVGAAVVLLGAYALWRLRR